MFVCSRLNSSSLLCDCQLPTLTQWLRQTGFHATVDARCRYPESLAGISILDIQPRDLSCGRQHLAHENVCYSPSFYSGYLFLSFFLFCQLHLKLTEWNSTKHRHMFASELDLKMRVQNFWCPSPKNWGPKHYFHLATTAALLVVVFKVCNNFKTTSS